MAGGHDQLDGIVRIGRAERPRFARDTGIDFAVRRTHRQVEDASLQHALLHDAFRSETMRRAENEISIHFGRSILAVGQFLGDDIARGTRVASGRLRAWWTLCRGRRWSGWRRLS